jgi:hypothetical protein
MFYIQGVQFMFLAPVLPSLSFPSLLAVFRVPLPVVTHSPLLFGSKWNRASRGTLAWKATAHKPRPNLDYNILVVGAEAAAGRAEAIGCGATKRCSRRLGGGSEVGKARCRASDGAIEGYRDFAFAG